MMRSHQLITVHTMRTTLDLDSTALEAARQLARHRTQSLGKVVSELILKGLQADAPTGRKSGFPVFSANRAKPITLEDIQRAEDDA
jgi:hypothetical protein